MGYLGTNRAFDIGWSKSDCSLHKWQVDWQILSEDTRVNFVSCETAVPDPGFSPLMSIAKNVLGGHTELSRNRRHPC